MKWKIKKKLLLIITITNSKQFIDKNKSIINIKIFVKLCN